MMHLMSKYVLIVDDHPDLRKLVRLTLAPFYEVAEARNGEEALAASRQRAPDVMLLDVMMPGRFDGYQVLESVRNDPALKDVKVVMLTARGQQVDIDRGRLGGVDDYIVKPFSPARLINVIEHVTEARQSANPL